MKVNRLGKVIFWPAPPLPLLSSSRTGKGCATPQLMLSHRSLTSSTLWTADCLYRQAAAMSDTLWHAACLPAAAAGCCSQGQSTRALGVAGGDLGTGPMLEE